MDSLPIVPLLEIRGDVINGMIRVCWTNFEEYELVTMDGGWYEFDYKISHNAYGEWRENAVDFDMDERDEFFIKVPMLLYPYELSFSFTLIIRQFDEEAEDNGHENVWTNLPECVSKIYNIQIPSFLLQAAFKKDKQIQFYPPNAPDACVIPGVIMEIMKNKKLVIKSAYGDAEILTLDSSKIVRDTVDPHFIADIIDQKAIESDLILKTNDEKKYKMYRALWTEINSFCCEALFEIVGFDDGQDDFLEMDYGPITTAIALNVYEYLYRADYKYRFHCLLGDSLLYLEQQWKYAVSQTLTEYQIEDIAYSCDLCRKEINLFEYAYHCKCDKLDHDFCISCIHSVLLQYNQMMPFMLNLLNNVLDDHCIEEIVTFCVGKAIRFDQDCDDDNQEDVMKQIDIGNIKF